MPLPIGTLSFLPRHTDSQTPGPSWNTDTGHRLQADRHHLCGPVLPQSATALGRHTFQCPARPSRSASRQPRSQRPSQTHCLTDSPIPGLPDSQSATALRRHTFQCPALLVSLCLSAAEKAMTISGSLLTDFLIPGLPIRDSTHRQPFQCPTLPSRAVSRQP